MRLHFLILLAVCSNITKAGPLRHRPALLQYVVSKFSCIFVRETDKCHRHNIGPRFLNASNDASMTTSETSTSTSSTISIPVSNDPSPIATPESRIASSEDGDQEQGDSQGKAAAHGAAGIDIAPEGAPAMDSTVTASPAATKALPSPVATHALDATSVTVNALAATSSATPNPTTSTLKASSEGSPNHQDKSSATLSESIGNLQDDQSITTATMQTQTAVPVPRLPAPFEAGGSVASSDTASQSESPSLSSGGAPLNDFSETATSAFESTETSASELAAAATEDALDAFQSARSKEATAALTSSLAASTQSASAFQNGQSSSTQVAATQTMTPAKEKQSQASNAVNSAPSADAVVGTQSSSSSQPSSQAIKSESVTSTFADADSSSIVQVPSSILGNGNPTTTESGSSSPSPTSSATPPKYAYPDASNGYAAMAQGYNKVFQTLNPLSKCDPSDSKQASACVDGQPAKCEVDGTYSLQSCDQGQSCYAVPNPQGQSGLTIACFNPNYANKLVADGGAAASSKGDSAINTQMIATSSSTALSPTSALRIVATHRSQTSNTASSGISSSAGSAQSFTVPPGAEADTEPSQSVEVSSSPANPVATLADFPTRVTTSGREQTIPGTSTPIPQLATTTTKDPIRNHEQTSLPGLDQPRPQQITSPSASPTSKAGGAVGVQLSFPGAGNSESNSEAGQPSQGNETPVPSPSTPLIAQKNAVHADLEQPAEQSSIASPPTINSNVAAAHIAPASTPPSQISSTAAASSPGITVAPMLGAGNQNGFITVTITQTTTIHDRE